MVKDKVFKLAKKIRQSSSQNYDPKKFFVMPDQTALERQDGLALRKKSPNMIQPLTSTRSSAEAG